MPRGFSNPKYPWRKYKDWPPMVDFNDQFGRLYLFAQGPVLKLFPIRRENNIAFEIKIPIKRGKQRFIEAQQFPKIGVLLRLTPFGLDTPVENLFRVREMYFAPRGATGVVIVENMGKV